MNRRPLVAAWVSAIVGILAATSASRAATVVVAPLHDASPQADADTVQGVADLVAGMLAEELVVVDRQKLDAVLREQGLSAGGLTDTAAAARVGKLLDADYVLSGSVFRRPGEIEFAVHLVRVAGGDVIKGITLSGSQDELLDVASELAAECAKALDVAPPTAEGEAVSAARLAAERYFLEALGTYHSGNYDRAIMNCLKVIELDPNRPKARLRLAESFLAAGEPDQARITLFRTLQLFPELAMTPRIRTLLGRIRPMTIQATAGEHVAVELPADWPRDARVTCELSWRGQPARRTTARADAGKVTLELPDARLPLDMQLAMTAGDHGPAERRIRLWPADTRIRRPEMASLLVVDPADQLVGLLGELELKHYRSCRDLPEPGPRVVIAPAAAAKLDGVEAGNVRAFIEAGGDVRIIGIAPPAMEIAGVKSTTVRWPMARDWTPKPNAPAWTFLDPGDLVGLAAHKSEATLLTGGTPWLSTGNGKLVLVAEAAQGDGRLLWIAWPAEWNPGDPRAARALALAISDVALPPAER